MNTRPTSQSDVAPCLRCGGTFDYYFTTSLLLNFLRKTFKIGQHLTKLWARKLIASSAIMRAGALLLNGELARNLTWRAGLL